MKIKCCSIIFISIFTTTQLNASITKIDTNKIRVYAGIGITTNFVIPENAFYLQHTPKYSGLGYLIEAGITGNSGILNFRLFKNNTCYTSSMVNTVDFRNVSNYNYQVTGFGISGCYKIIKKSNLSILHGYSIDIFNINRATLNFIQNDLILNTSDTINDINVINYQKVQNRIQISAILRAEYKMPFIKGLGIFSSWSISKTLIDANDLGIDILTYFGGLSQSAQIGLKYEIF